MNKLFNCELPNDYDCARISSFCVFYHLKKKQVIKYDKSLTYIINSIPNHGIYFSNERIKIYSYHHLSSQFILQIIINVSFHPH